MALEQKTIKSEKARDKPCNVMIADMLSHLENVKYK